MTNQRRLLWAVGLTLFYFIFIPFPLSIILCILTGIILPWIGNDNNSNSNNKKDVDR